MKTAGTTEHESMLENSPYYSDLFHYYGYLLPLEVARKQCFFHHVPIHELEADFPSGSIQTIKFVQWLGY